MSLRARLLAGVLVLVAAGLVVASVATYAALRSFLTTRVDEQLVAAAAPVGRELLFGSRPGVRTTGTTGKAMVPLGTYAQLRNGNGDVTATLTSTFGDAGDPPPELPQALPMPDGGNKRMFNVEAQGGGARYRVLATPLSGGSPDDGSLVLALPLREVHQTLRRLLVIEGVVTVSILAVLGALGFWVVRVGLRPLAQIEATAGAIAAGDLARRIERDDERTEVGRLGRALNAMLGHIEGAFAERTASEHRLRRFVADASHELRTPLTSIRGYAELFRRGAADRPQDLATAMRRIEEEAGRMGVLVDDLLLLARLDQGQSLARSPVDLVQIASDAVADLRVVDADRPVQLEGAGSVVVSGDEARLRQVAANLLSNARLHTPGGTPVHVRVRASDGSAVLEVTDEGPGLAPDEAERVFERFYRADPSRSRASGGTGLGLSIVAAIARSHGGAASVESRPGAGATFRVALPLDGALCPVPRPEATSGPVSRTSPVPEGES
ncbi:MAG: HAMP domain-containing histidine kinase [Actinomycetota bacterium]|nr:HAMP domain-containing histidine kinase [Actinomycetota bacterium]